VSLVLAGREDDKQPAGVSRRVFTQQTQLFGYIEISNEAGDDLNDNALCYPPGITGGHIKPGPQLPIGL
jgi:hypothetical protein